MEFKMHNTHFSSHIENQSVLSASFEQVGFNEPEAEYIIKEIDFDSMMADKEYFATEIKSDKLKVFIGEEDESTEIDSIITSLDRSTQVSAGMTNPFKMCRNFEQQVGEEAGEILAILKKHPQTSKNELYLRNFSRSNPNLYTSKKISLTGRVLQNIPGSKRNIPERVSNPFNKNFFDVTDLKLNNFKPSEGGN